MALIPMLSEHLGVKDQELLEKDVRLHALLGSLARDPTFGSHLVFKGGTCLIKCYLDYPRFSTDLDFTWLSGAGEERNGHGTKRLRRRIRPTQRILEAWFKDWAMRQGYSSEDPQFFNYGRSNRMMTVNLRYPSASAEGGLVKVQINFEDPLLYPTVSTQARSLLRGTVPAAFRLLEGDPATGYATALPVTAYDPREILVEKCRAILTRTAAKSRDLVDLFLLERDRGLRVENDEAGVVEKTRRSVQGSARYRAQARRFDEREALLLEEDVRPLLLKPIDVDAFQRHRERVIPFLKGLLPRILA
ncbi:MAG: nucleotidyl transferase AbiEii/AbiGii toxin family protein [Thermoplasmata archaeon]